MLKILLSNLGRLNSNSEVRLWKVSRLNRALVILSPPSPPNFPPLPTLASTLSPPIKWLLWNLQKTVSFFLEN